MRAQSEVIGLVILFGLSVTAIGIVLAFGQPAISDASESAQFDRMQNEFALLDSRISTSALGASESQSVSLNVGSGTLMSNPDASWMSVEYDNATGFNSELANITMGNVKYVQGDRTIAYEGGGVWKSEKGSDFTELVSTPEFHYKGSTLTLPAYNVTGAGGFSGEGNSLFVGSAGNPELEFPDGSLDNPLQEGNVTITVKSEYYRGWEKYFRGRTTGAIESVNEEEQKVKFSLEVPTELLLTAGIMYTPGGSVNTKSNPTVGSTSQIDVNLPDTDTIIQPELDKCFPNPGTEPNCVDLTTKSSGADLQENNIYYVSSSNTPYTMGDFDAPNANVTILVDGTVEYKKDFDVGTSSADPVEVYADGDVYFSGGGDINTAPDTGNASMFITYASGKADRAGGGTVDYTGIIYAPATNHNGGSCSGSEKFNGDLTITGTVITTSACVKGNAKLTFDDELDFLDLTPDVSLIRYLHITENEVRVSK